jgi:hypothetical protein
MQLSLDTAISDEVSLTGDADHFSATMRLVVQFYYAHPVWVRLANVGVQGQWLFIVTNLRLWI